MLVIIKMRFVLVVLSVIFALSTVIDATRVRKCNSSDGVAENPNINISACEKLPCKLRRKNDILVEYKFKPEKDTEKLINSVHAQILGIPFPFIGVDGGNACNKLFDAKGAKVNCPLKAGQEYVFKDSFPVLEIYPKVKAWVHWGLVDGEGKNVMCFEVPTKITS